MSRRLCQLYGGSRHLYEQTVMSTMTPSAPNTVLEAIREQFGAVLVRSMEAVAFWLAVALPFLYLPLLANGTSGQEAVVFVGLLVVNVVALVAGHGYHRNE